MPGAWRIAAWGLALTRRHQETGIAALVESLSITHHKRIISVGSDVIRE
jgi:hypothetical protein